MRTVRETEIFAGTGIACNDLATDIDGRLESLRIIKTLHLVKCNNCQTLWIHVQVADHLGCASLFINRLIRQRLGQLIGQPIVSLVAVLAIMKDVLRHRSHVQDKANLVALLNL